MDWNNCEDLLHFMWKCPAYDHIRDECAPLFEPSSAASVPSCLGKGLFCIGHQRQLARCVSAIDVPRHHILGKGVCLDLEPVVYIDTLAYSACLSHGPTGRRPPCCFLMHKTGGSVQNMLQEAIGITWEHLWWLHYVSLCVSHVLLLWGVPVHGAIFRPLQ